MIYAKFIPAFRDPYTTIKENKDENNVHIEIWYVCIVVRYLSKEVYTPSFHVNWTFIYNYDKNLVMYGDILHGNMFPYTYI